RDRVRLDGGLRGGTGHPQVGQYRKADARDRRGDDAATRSRTLQVRSRLERNHGSLATRERHRIVAPRPDRAGADRRSRARKIRRTRFGFGRGALDDQSGDRRSRSGAGAHGGALCTVQFARGSRVPKQAPLRNALRVRRSHRDQMNVLAIDVGGTHVKVLATGQPASRRFSSGPTLTPQQMVDEVKKLVEDWPYDAISIGYPGPVVNGRITAEPYN